MAFVQEDHYPLQRVLSAVSPVTRAVLFFDACPSGGGAVLYSIPYGDLTDPAVIQDNFVARHFTSVVWSAACEQAAGALIGDPGSQARWEAYAMVASIMMWERFLFAPSVELLVVGDPLGVLDGACKLRAKDTVINELFMELAFIFARHGTSLEAVHIWSGDNRLADELSRGLRPAALPVDVFVTWTTPRWRIARHLS